jgi:ABC-type branched-subunit amino acid transport system substrate-binding protein
VKRFGALVFAEVAVLLSFNGAHSTERQVSADPVAIGRRIYREGILPTGQDLRGLGQAGVTLSGKAAACVTCHRRSGYGSSEGPIEVRAITGPALFGERAAPVAPHAPQSLGTGLHAAPYVGNASAARDQAHAKALALRSARAALFAGTRQRPVYDNAALARAIRQGVDVAGDAMDATMPRYPLDSAALDSLSAYLRTLSAAASPGVTETAVHFATVIQPGADTAHRSAVIDVLQTYFRDRNQGQRAEIRREQAGQVHLGRTYREWVLHVWDLKGASDTWGAQLAQFYREQPVFALASGIGKASWLPIHDFSERYEVPCIFPQTDLPVLNGENFFTVYLSQGVTLEAKALAKFLHDGGARDPVLQVYRRDAAGATAATAFRKAWTGADAALSDQVLEVSPTAEFWEQLAHTAAGASLVLWLAPEDLAHAQALTSAASPLKAVYLSSALSGDQHAGLQAGHPSRLRMIYPQDLPAVRAARLAVVKRWLKNNNIALSDETLQLNAYLAATVLGMVVSHSKDTYSREFLLERMEHRLGNSLELSIFPHLSLGPGQRFASKGSYIVSVEGGGETQLSVLSEWIVP